MIRKYFSCFLTVILFTGFSSLSQDKPADDPSFYKGVSKWFSAWELVSKDIYHLDSFSPVEFVFFDSQYVYSNSNITIPQGDLVNGPALLGHQIIWKRTKHNDSLTLPDKSRVPIGLMSFAAGIPGENSKPFFVMPLPSFWQKAGVTSEELGDENLYTGVFLHEFSHSQQMKVFGKNVTEFEKKYDFGIEFSDDIVQHLFATDSSYVRDFNAELNLFYEAAFQKDSALKIQYVKVGMDILHMRHRISFVGKYESLSLIDDFFLTMEGLGQYTMYVWLIHKNGANISVETAIAGVRRGKKWWSQEEGFALFLVLEQLSDPRNWVRQMFGSQTNGVLRHIRLILTSRDAKQ